MFQAIAFPTHSRIRRVPTSTAPSLSAVSGLLTGFSVSSWCTRTIHCGRIRSCRNLGALVFAADAAVVIFRKLTSSRGVTTKVIGTPTRTIASARCNTTITAHTDAGSSSSSPSLSGLPSLSRWQYRGYRLLTSPEQFRYLQRKSLEEFYLLPDYSSSHSSSGSGSGRSRVGLSVGGTSGSGTGSGNSSNSVIVGRMGGCLRKESRRPVHGYTRLMDDREQSTLVTTDGARVSRLCENNQLLEFYFDDVTTVYEAFQRGVRVAGDNPCLGWKPDPSTPYQWMTYNEVNQRATNFGSGLMGLGIKPQNDIRIGVYSQNRPEYVVSDLAFSRHSLTGVPLYDTLGVDACGFIINQAELSIIVCDNNDKVKKLLDRRKEYPQLHTLVLFEPISEESKTRAAAEGIKLLQFTDVEESGKQNPVDATPSKPDDLYIVCYTSGTTGTPKGAMISHGNIVGAMAGALKQLDACGVGLNSDDLIMSYLPLAHSYERILETSTLATGAAIGFFQGDVKKLMDDIKELRPTIFPSVPRLLNRLFDKVSSGVNASRIKKMLFSFAMSSKTKELKRGVIRNNSIWDKVVFGKIQAALGGRVRAITTGSAPLSAEVLTFLRCIVGCPILEGYGQTENSAVATLTIVGDSEAGHVGPPLPSNMIKLADVPEMDYYSNNNKGEVCIKGPNVFKGYLKDEEKTKEAIDQDGWLHTGDIGEWLPSGALRIIDRKKNIFKLAQGEYIAPEKIENVLIQSPFLAQVYVHGNSLESYLVGVVVPDVETLPGLASKLGVSGSFEEMCSNPALKKAIQDDLSQLGKKNGLSSLEQMKDIHICTELFSVENGLMTPTFKTKRNVLATHFAPQISDMYERTNAALSAKS